MEVAVKAGGEAVAIKGKPAWRYRWGGRMSDLRRA